MPATSLAVRRPIGATVPSARVGPRRRRWILAAIVLLGFCSWWALVSFPTPAFNDEALEQQAYVWQRDWRRVPEGLESWPDDVRRICLLACELTVARPARPPARIDVAFDSEALRDLVRNRGVRVALVLRLGPVSGQLERAPAVLRALGEAIEESLARAGVPVAEVQIDFDAAERQLAAYARWLSALRARVPRSVELTATALPAWLDRDAMHAVARAVDGFVLQVHGLPQRSKIHPGVRLCDPIAARRAVRIAARFGSPFRVALPTYGYVLGFDAAGRLRGLAAEGERPAWPSGTRVVDILADAVAMADLVAHWETRHPRLMTGILWYRYPLPGDRRMWSRATWDAVRRGEKPMPVLKITAVPEAADRTAVRIINTGSDAAVPPTRIRVRIAEGIDLGQGLSGWRFEREAPDRGVFVRTRRAPTLAPGAEQVVGWLRHASGVQVQIDRKASEE